MSGSVVILCKSGVGDEKRKRAGETETKGTREKESEREREKERENFLSVGTLACHHPRSVINTVGSV